MIPKTPYSSSEGHLYTLECGLRVLHLPTQSPIAYVGYAVPAGSGHDPRPYHGLAHLVEHMLFKGTPLRNAGMLIRRIEEVGADVNAFTTKTDTFVHAAVPVRYTGRVVSALTDIVLRSSFPAEELSKEQGVICEEIHSYEDSPEEAIFDEFDTLLFRGHPYAHNILGTEHSVGRITPAVAGRFLASYYTPRQMVFCLMGLQEIAPVLDRLNAQFARYTPTHRPFHTPHLSGNPRVVPTAGSTASPFYITHRRDTAQAHCLIGALAPHREDPLRIPTSLLCNILGGPAMSSELNMLLREQNGLVYSVEASYQPLKEWGELTIYLGCAPKNLEQATRLVHQVLDRYCTQELSQEALSKAKRRLKGQLALAQDTPETLFLSQIKHFLHYGSALNMDLLAQQIEQIAPQDLSRAASKYLTPALRHTLVYR